MLVMLNEAFLLEVKLKASDCQSSQLCLCSSKVWKSDYLLKDWVIRNQPFTECGVKEDYQDQNPFFHQAENIETSFFFTWFQVL